MAFLDNIFDPSNYGGILGRVEPSASSGFDASNDPSMSILERLRALLSQNGGYASGAPSDVAVAAQQPDTQAFPTSNVPSVPFGNMIPGQPAPILPPPTNVSDVRGPDSFGSYGGIPYPIFGQPDQLDLSARGKTPVPTITQADIQAQVPQALPQEASPDLLQRLQAGAVNFTTGGNPIAGLFNTISGLATGQRTDAVGIQQQNQKQMALAAFQILRSEGVPETQAYGMAQLIAVNPKLAETIFKQPTTVEGVIARKMTAGSQQDPFQTLEQLKRAEARGSKAGQTEGEITAQGNIDLPGAVATAQEAMRVAESLRNHPGRTGNIWWHGKLSNALPDASIPGNTDAFDANLRLRQLTSSAFATAYSALKGGGQISNIEGQKMTESLNRMNRASSKEEFDNALNDFEGILKLGIDRAANRAGKTAPYGFQGNRNQGLTSSGIKWSVQ